MIKHYITLAWRNALKNKLFSFINLFGLSIGIAVSIMLFLYVQHELSYDRFHEKADRISRVGVFGKLGDSEFRQTYTTPQLAPTLMQDISPIESACRVENLESIFIKIIENGQVVKSLEEKRIYAADSTFFDIFSFPLLAGNPATVLREKGKILITASSAEKYFGRNWDTQQIIGKTLFFADNEEDTPFEIEGILQDVPEASHFHFDFLISTKELSYINEDNWQNNYLSTYILLKEGASAENVEAALPEVYRKHLGFENFDQWWAEGNRWGSFLQSLTDIHLKSHLNGEFEPNGSITYIYIFSSAGLLVLILACINFINLTTAKSLSRAKEIGVKKVMGSSRKQLVIQHLGESFFICLTSVLLALLICEAAFPLLKRLTGQSLHIDYFGNWLTLPLLLVLTLIVSLLSGIYPAFYLTSMEPVKVLSGKLQKTRQKTSFRNGLIVFQFAICYMMVIGTLVIGQQIDFIQNQNLGFNKENVLVLRNSAVLGKRAGLFNQQLSNYNSISQVSASNSIPGEEFNNVQFYPEGTKNMALEFSWTDEDFANTYGIKMREGRFFSTQYATDSFAAVINQQAADEFGWKEPIGKKIQLYGEDGTTYTVVGVTENFHYASMHMAIKPMLLLPEFSPQSWGNNFISVRVSSRNVQKTLAYIEKQWSTFTDLPFDYFFFDAHYNQLYHNEILTGQLINLFTWLIGIVALLGLLGLVTFHATQRIKEIGIRKVLGASISNILILLTKDYLKLILIAIIIAIPIANYLAVEWLNNFVYRTEIQWWLYALPSLLVLTIAFLSVSGQALKAARRNPVDSLRYE